MIREQIIFYADKDNILESYYLDSTKTPIPIDGASARLVVRKGRLDAAPLFEQAATVDGPEGKMTFTVPKASTAGILGADEIERELPYGIELTLATGEELIIADSDLVLRLPIARD